MSLRLTVRGDESGTFWHVNDWAFLVALSALSVEPETMAEFFNAVGRYQPNHRWEETGQQAASIEDALAEDGDWCLIDLSSRSVVAGSACDLPERKSAFQATNDEQGDGFHLVWIDIPLAWQFEVAQDNWMAQIAERAQAFQRQERVDTRLVLFGDPLLEFIATRMQSDVCMEFTGEVPIDRIRAIHADWMLTAREDLLGQTPREVLLSRREQIDLDIQRRSEQWSRQGFAPTALDPASNTYRFGGYGTTEVVLYFDIVRSLFCQAWHCLKENDLAADALIRRLAQHRDQVLARPPEDGISELTCSQLIESERRRLPVADDGAPFDCDCPICVAQAEGAFGSGPMFSFFDGHHLELEDDFAFSMIESREEWDWMDRANRCYDEHVDKEIEPNQVTSNGSEPELESVWTNSSVDWDRVFTDGSSPASAKLAIGFPLAELVANLKLRHADEETIYALNSAFTAFRRAEEGIAELSAAETLRQCLENIATAHPELVARSADLQGRLDEVLRV